MTIELNSDRPVSCQPYRIPFARRDTVNTIVEEAIACLDDIIIPSMDVEQGLERLEKFMVVLAKSGLTLRTSKCRFLAEEITFLGLRITRNGITPGEENVFTADQYPRAPPFSRINWFLSKMFTKFRRALMHWLMETQSSFGYQNTLQLLKHWSPAWSANQYSCSLIETKTTRSSYWCQRNGLSRYIHSGIQRRLEPCILL